MIAELKQIIDKQFQITIKLALCGQWEAVAAISAELVSCLPKNMTALWNFAQVETRLGRVAKATQVLNKIKQLHEKDQLEMDFTEYTIMPKAFDERISSLLSTSIRELRAISSFTVKQARSHVPQGEIRALCVIFYRNGLHTAEALKYFGWCDVFYCEHANGVNPEATVGEISDLNRLNIDYSKYDVCLSFNDSLSPGSALDEHLLRCLENGLPVIGNQHGYDKSVIDLLEYAPNIFTYRWNALGQYWLDRLEREGMDWVSKRWMSLGSLKNDYLYRTTRWGPNKTNGKILLLHEPDTDECEQDPNPLKPSSVTKEVVECLLERGIDFDFKVHPGWPNFVGNKGALLWKPAAEVSLVDCGLTDMANYEAVVGCYSTALLDAASMGIPVINVEFDYPSLRGAHWGPGELKLFPQVPARDVVDLFGVIRGKEMHYDYDLLKYFLGPLGSVNENYQEYLRLALEELSGSCAEESLRSLRSDESEKSGVSHCVFDQAAMP